MQENLLITSLIIFDCTKELQTMLQQVIILQREWLTEWKASLSRSNLKRGLIRRVTPTHNAKLNRSKTESKNFSPRTGFFNPRSFAKFIAPWRLVDSAALTKPEARMLFN